MALHTWLSALVSVILIHQARSNLPPGFKVTAAEDGKAITTNSGRRSFGLTDCVDFSIFTCLMFADYCKSHPAIHPYCPATCGICKKQCQDQYPNYCQMNADQCDVKFEWDEEPYHNTICPKTCGECKDEEGGTWGDFGSWGDCSAKCAGGTQRRTRTCSGGTCQGDNFEERKCNEQACVWNDWGDWSVCSKKCNVGTSTRTRTCDGPKCDGSTTQNRRCNTRPCRWSAWGDYSKCTKTCDGGRQYRIRTCEIENECSGKGREERTCNTNACQAVWGNWGVWGACSKPCGEGEQSRTRICQSGSCPGTNTQKRSCNTQDCEWQAWGIFGPCTKDCGGGKRTRTRQCESGGVCSGPSSETEDCNTNTCQCASPSTWGSYTAFSACTQKCGGGTKTRTRVCNKPCANSPNCDGSAIDTRQCNTHTCQNIDTDCSKTCGLGVKIVNGKYVSCNEHKCPTKTCPSGHALFYKDDENRCCKRVEQTGGSMPCGLQALNTQRMLSTHRVLGGTNSLPKELPWSCFVMPTFCGGTIIGRRHVLSAGHCTQQEQLDGTFKSVQADKFVIFMGRTYISASIRNSGTPNVAAVYAHPQYNFPYNDIAVFKLRTELSWTDYIRPACLPDVSFEPASDSTCIISGFGVADIRLNALSEFLQTAPVEKFDMDVCLKGYVGDSNLAALKSDGHKMICAGTISGAKDSCAGDSGSALMCQREGSCAHTVAGIVSFGPTICGQERKPGVYVKTSSYLPWINAQMAK